MIVAVEVNRDFSENARMKKDVSMTVRLETPLGELVQKLADDDDRSIGYVLRMLVVEALQARKLLPKGGKPASKP
jgi:hypothetical protein